MTEQEWLECVDSKALLAFLSGKVSERKLRLFAVACGRRCAQWEEGRDCTLALRTLDLWGDGQIPATGLEQAREQVFATGVMPLLLFDILKSEWDAAYVAVSAVSKATIGAWNMSLTPEARKNLEFIDVFPNFNIPRCLAAEQDELAARCASVRDIVGNPFRPITFDPVWHSSTVVSLATAIYEDRAFDRLPILADALEDAGCTNADILNHCRQPGEHVRGCWVVDLVLDRK